MPNSQAAEQLLKRLIATGGLAVRRSADDEAFWYTSGKPGPFYINTEQIAGRQLAQDVLQRLDDALITDAAAERRAQAIWGILHQAVRADDQYGAAIEALTAYYLDRHARPALISGGERRDWFFSIPMAARLGVPHVMLFKNGEHQVTDHEGNAVRLELRGQRVLHVADIINQASSYVNRWIPILNRAGVHFAETLSVAVRSREGMEKLADQGVSVLSPLTVDRPLFKEAYELGLINAFAYREILHYYESPLDWTRHYIAAMRPARERRLPVKGSEERERHFKAHDPFGLKAEFPAYFV
ncbi:phosphoribosyltransferase [Paenibacillus lycopersici]|uniref:Phosphoribosyltransferase n=1 Tax=Paenibacillus lycopersici TaxID=2704462 RepID=A0A6C0FXD2_9BACL|nr:phosphoribosyltransferase [Paenibacillus lycopersici]QHT59944.1 phosphoribosyltransferase [Paenibacillus lycopersici]